MILHTPIVIEGRSNKARNGILLVKINIDNSIYTVIILYAPQHAPCILLGLNNVCCIVTLVITTNFIYLQYATPANIHVYVCYIFGDIF